MIYITGDCHGDWTRFSSKNFPEQKEMTKKDYVIVCGDFGYWTPSVEQNYWLKWLDSKPFTTLFVDGNHEDFDDLYALPVERWNRGNVHKVEETVLHLMRGQVFSIDECKIFTFGGARSHDIQGGILEPSDPDFLVKKKKLNRGTLPYRINHRTWWKEELPNQDEMNEGLYNLEEHNWKVNYIITHCCSSSTQSLLSNGCYKPDLLTGYLEEVRRRTEFTRWFFGHYHDNRQINAQEIMLYEQIIRIW